VDARKNSSVRDADALLSHLVMGFIERRVAPQTISDIILAQVNESGVEPEDFQAATLNGVLESIAGSNAASGLQEIIVFLAKRRDFPEFLSPASVLASLSALLTHPLRGIQPGDGRFEQFCQILDQLALRSTVVLAKSNPNALKLGKMRLVNAVKSASGLIAALAQYCPQLVILRQVLLKPVATGVPQVSKGDLADVPAVLATIRTLPDSVLVHKTPRDYKTGAETAGVLNKLRHLEIVIAALVPNVGSESQDLSRAVSALGEWTPFKRSFVVEWLLSGCLREVLLNKGDRSLLAESLRVLFSRTNMHLDVLKGAARAFQKDLCGIVLPDHLEHQPAGTNIPSAALRNEYLQVAATLFFAALYDSQRSDSAVTLSEQLAAEFVPWALQLPCDPPECRIVTRAQLTWLRIVETREWVEGLSQPPKWIFEKANQNAALIFQIAPGHWLQANASYFVDALWQESLHSEFQVSPAHHDYVEFLIRSMRKKSPLFASEVELLICLHLLGRAQSSEQAQIKLAHTRLKMTEQPDRPLSAEARATLEVLEDGEEKLALGPNPLARALALLSRTCWNVEAKAARLQVNSDGFRVRS
jgi:hypothetical protein